MKQMFLSVVLLASLDRGTLYVEHPRVSFKVPAVLGKPTSPTPPGVYLLTRGYAKSIGMRVLIFRRDGNNVWAIHPNLPTRARQLKTETPADNYLSGGCIGVEQNVFDRLWDINQTMVLQVY